MAVKPEALDIAIIGMAGAYAGARDAASYWQNILDKVDAVDEAGAEWAGPYLDPSAKSNDRIYTTRGGFLKDNAEVDLSELGVMPNTLDGGEPDHMLALRFARDALLDSGYLAKPFNRERCGIVLGRGTYANRGILTMVQHGLIMDQTIELVRGLRPDMSEAELAALKAALKQQLPPYNAEMVGLLTPTVIAGLIANRLDLMGPNFIVDAACASSLIAIEVAVRELQSGRCDMMITGGVQAQCPPQLYMQFCQLNALSRGQLRPFQKGADGTLLGEGVGLIVLKKLAAAEADGDRIYAVIKGIGTASDGKAKGLLTPRLEGEILALRRAYESSGIDPASIGLIEAHGTGTRVGDRTEIESLTAMFGPRCGDLPHIALGSVKSMISHCLPAAGSASMIKTALALHHKLLPPMICDEIDPDLQIERTPFYINTEARPWIHGGPHPRRAGVNAFGFGGINAHVILEEYRPSANNSARKTAMAMLHAPGHSELLTLAAGSSGDLATLAEQLLAHARGPSRPSLAMLAKASSASASGEHRLAIVAGDVADLVTKLEQAIVRLNRSDAAPFKTRAGVHYGRGAAPGRSCFLFPGEGAQYSNMLADICLHFPQARAWFDFIDETAVRRGTPLRSGVVFPAPTALAAATRERLEGSLFEMDIAAETVFAASMAMFEILDDLGLRPDAMLGHSTGENSAITASGVRRYQKREEIADTVRELNRIYRELDEQGRIVEGSLLTIGALKPAARAQMLLDCAGDDSPIRVAMDNCPNQLVLFGSRFDIAALKDKLSAEGAICAELPFGRAYHTALFRPVADAYRDYYATLEFGPGRTVLYSARSMAPFPENANEIRELAAQQWENPVRFTETVEKLYADGVRVFIEVGPSGNLTSFVGDVLRDRDDAIAVSSNSRRKSGIGQLHQTLAQLYAIGVAMRPAALYAHREIAELRLDAPPLAAPKTKPRLKLQMPLVHLPQEFKAAAAAQSRRVAEDHLGAQAEPNPKVVHLERRRKSEPPSEIETAAASDPRLDTLKTHFALMQEFLDSQSRVLGLAAPHPAATATVANEAGGAEVQAEPVPALIDGAQPDPERFPLLGRIVERTRDRLICERTYDSDLDLFLQDHAIGSPPTARQPALLPLTVIPFTFSMEILAQAACLLTGGTMKVIGVDNARGHRWLGLDDGRLPIRIVAERVPASRPELERIQVRLFQLVDAAPKTGVMVYEGQVVLAENYPEAPPVRAWTAPQDFPARNNPDGELYSHGMFHGPRLQGVKSIRRWADEAIEAELVTIATQDYFSFTDRPEFRIDSALLDAAGQLAGYWLTEKYTWGFNCFPYHLGHYTQYAPLLPPGTKVTCRGDVRMSDELRIEAHFDVFDDSGRLLFRAANWEDRKFSVPPHLYDFRLDPQARFLSEPWLPAELAGSGVFARRLVPFDEGFMDQGWGIWKRMLANLVLAAEERQVFYRELPLAGPRREEWLMGRVAAKDAVREWALQHHGLRLAPADVVILSGARGEPVVIRADGLPAGIPLPSISISHSRRWAVAACTDGGLRLGADYQHLDRVDAEDLIAGAFEIAETQTFLRSLPLAEQKRAAVALWCAKEAAAKAAGTGLEARPKDWEIVAAEFELRGERRPRAVVRHSHTDYAIDLRFGDGEVFALCRADAEPVSAARVAQA
ncbi:MAG: beta-ketoacyl synthase N-terminal-like domain-containing protein [Nevskia sp.]